MRLHPIAVAARAALLAVCALGMLPAAADRVLLGSDYFQTIQPTIFPPAGALTGLPGVAGGLPPGLGTTDTIVRRLGNCDLGLASTGSNCTIPIEMIALSLVGVINPLMRVRESPTLASTGSMTMTSDGSGTGGTFNSFFDVFFELSVDGGATFTPQGPLHLTSTASPWTTIEPPAPNLFVNGLIGGVGDMAANRHTNKGTAACPVITSGMTCVDFYAPIVTEQHPNGVIHTARNALAPEPGALALAALGLLLMAGLAQHSLRLRH